MEPGEVSRKPVLGVSITTMERHQAVEAVLDAARRGTSLGLSALAVHGVMEAVADPELQFRLNDLEMVVPDGQPVRWALDWLHRVRLTDRVSGPDLMDDLCAAAAREGLPIYCYGSTAETLAALCARLVARHPSLQVAGAKSSRFRPATAAEQQADAEEIRASGARMVFVGLGCPRQEIWTYEMRTTLSMPVLAVGAAFDFHAGTVARAPLWMQRRGLEWLYRLRREPKRLWRRYLLLNPKYLALVALERLGIKRIPLERARVPAEPVRPG
jgi:exopolysaccharide biosynthesis WecB/TagA/CpsF family protein